MEMRHAQDTGPPDLENNEETVTLHRNWNAGGQEGPPIPSR